MVRRRGRGRECECWGGAGRDGGRGRPRRRLVADESHRPPPPCALRVSAARRRGGAALPPSRPLALLPSPALRKLGVCAPLYGARPAVVGSVTCPPLPFRPGAFPCGRGRPLRAASPAVGGQRSEFRPLRFTLLCRAEFRPDGVLFGQRCCGARAVLRPCQP